MWDGSINHLEMQPLAPMTNPIEMNESIEHVIHKLQLRKDFVTLFKAAFGDTVINSERMLKALAQFTGMMISANSKYDRYMDGTEDLSASEKNGLELFRSNCITCHPEPLFTDETFTNIGLRPDTALRDSGRTKVTGLPADYMKFKVPALRNVELTYPYMHDGRFKTLKQVLDYYADGIYFTDNYDRRVTKMRGMSEADKADIIAFLKTLTDKEFLYDRRFADPNFH